MTEDTAEALWQVLNVVRWLVGLAIIGAVCYHYPDAFWFVLIIIRILLEVVSD